MGNKHLTSRGHGFVPQEVPLGQVPLVEPANKILVYAVEQVQTTADNFTEQGFGYSTPLKTPIKTTYFRWDGKLHQSEPGVVGNSGGGSTPEACGQHFSPNYMTHLNPEAQRMERPSYMLDFDHLPPKVEGARLLTDGEKERFLAAFRQANEAASKRTKQQ